MKKDLIEDAQTLARYSLASPKLRIGVVDTRPNIPRETGRPAGYDSCQASAGSSNERQTDRMQTQNFGSEREPQRRFGRSANQQGADALADFEQENCSCYERIQAAVLGTQASTAVTRKTVACALQRFVLQL